MDEQTVRQQTPAASDAAERRAGIAGFLGRRAPFDRLRPDELSAIAKLARERTVPPGESVLVENGPPGTELFVVRTGLVEMMRGEQVVDLLGPGQVFGHPTLLTGLSPEFTMRARESSLLYAIPGAAAVALLNSPDGAAFVVRTLHQRPVRTTRTLRDLPRPRTTPVTSLIRRPPVFCEPDATVREVARLMDEEVVTAVLVRTRGGLGMITDADLRSKVLAAGVTADAPASSIMTVPVTTVGAEALAPEAVVYMLQCGVNHLPVVTVGGEVLGVISAGSLMALDELSPFALRWSFAAAHDEAELAAAATHLPQFFPALVDAGLEPMTVMRLVTLQSDSITRRLIELAVARNGVPPADFARLALGDAARSEFTLASDQDNALAYADSDDPAVDAYFAQVAREVHDGLVQCGFEADPSGVTAADHHWRMAQSGLTDLRLSRHAEAARGGRRPDDVTRTEELRPLVYAELHEALKMVAAEQRRVMG